MRPLTPEQLAGLLQCLAEHVQSKLDRVGCQPPEASGCAVLLALDVLSCAVALGPFDLPELGIQVFDTGDPPT